MNIIDDDLLAFIQNAHGAESHGVFCGFSRLLGILRNQKQ